MRNGNLENPHLISDRLMLRPLMIKDVNEIFFLRTNETVNRFLDRPLIRTMNDAKEFIQLIEDRALYNECFYWAICLKNTDCLIGTISLFDFSQDNEKAELGFELNTDFHGQGIMQEAIQMVLKYVFEQKEVDVILAYTVIENVKSVALLERNGFILDEELKYTERKTLGNLVGYFLQTNINFKQF
jgi:[ribosomal protein S5]-alanine N-acetyltransferase